MVSSLLYFIHSFRFSLAFPPEGHPRQYSSCMLLVPCQHYVMVVSLFSGTPTLWKRTVEFAHVQSLFSLLLIVLPTLLAKLRLGPAQDLRAIVVPPSAAAITFAALK